MKILSASYHRNGISGKGFVVAKVLLDEEVLVVTISYMDDGETLDETQCRVLNPFWLAQRYRGDQIGGKLKRQRAKLERLLEMDRING